MFQFPRLPPSMVTAENALPGREQVVYTPALAHELFSIEIDQVPVGSEVSYFALGCFWGAEKVFWKTAGVTNTAVGYQGGFTINPTYEQVCTGRTGHAEVVRVCFDPQVVSYANLVRLFFEAHNPTQGFRQGNDIGTQYRSALYVTSDAQLAVAEKILAVAKQAYSAADYGQVTTEVRRAGKWYFAEDYHQQYLIKNPAGYDCHVRTGVACPLPKTEPKLTE